MPPYVELKVEIVNHEGGLVIRGMMHKVALEHLEAHQKDYRMTLKNMLLNACFLFAPNSDHWYP